MTEDQEMDLRVRLGNMIMRCASYDGVDLAQEEDAEDLVFKIMSMLRNDGLLNQPPANTILRPENPEDADCSDFILTDGSCWIEVGELVAYIIDREGAIEVQILPAHSDDVGHMDALDTAYATEADIPEP